MKKKTISVTFINHQNKVFEFSNIVLKDNNGMSIYSDRFVDSFLRENFGNDDYFKFDILKKLSHDSNKASDSWNITNKFEKKCANNLVSIEKCTTFADQHILPYCICGTFPIHLL